MKDETKPVKSVSIAELVEKSKLDIYNKIDRKYPKSGKTLANNMNMKGTVKLLFGKVNFFKDETALKDFCKEIVTRYGL